MRCVHQHVKRRCLPVLAARKLSRHFLPRELSVRQVLDLVDDDQALAKMPVDQMLRALPGIGAVRAEKIMEELQIAPTRRLGRSWRASTP